MEIVLVVLILAALIGLWVFLPATKTEHKAHVSSSVSSFQQRA